MMIKPWKVLSKLKNLGQPWYHSLIIHNFDHLMWQKAIWKGKHPELMRLLSQVFEQLPIRELEVREEMYQQVKHGKHFLNPLILKL